MANTPRSEVYGRLVDAATRSVSGPNVYLGGGPGIGVDRELPCVNQESAGSDSSWIVGWQELDRSIVGGNWRFKIARISPATLTRSVTIGYNSAILSHIDVRIAGRDGRYLATSLWDYSSGPYGDGLAAQRFDWPENAAIPSLGLVRIVATGGPLDFTNGGLAYDSTTTSHWGIVYLPW